MSTAQYMADCLATPHLTVCDVPLFQRSLYYNMHTELIYPRVLLRFACKRVQELIINYATNYRRYYQTMHIGAVIFVVAAILFCVVMIRVRVDQSHGFVSTVDAGRMKME